MTARTRAILSDPEWYVVLQLCWATERIACLTRDLELTDTERAWFGVSSLALD